MAGTAIEYHASIKDGVFRETEPIRLPVLSKSSISPPTGHNDAKLPVSAYDFRIRKGDDLERSKKTLKRCLKWKAGAATVVGGLLGLFGGPGGSAAGAVLTGGLAAGACADAVIDRIDKIIEDFCACLSKNDCPPHEWCKVKKDTDRK